MLDYIVYALLFILTAIVSGNNLPACSGAIISGRIVAKRFGIAVTILGYIAGFLVQGSFLRAGLLALLPVQSEALIVLAMAISFLVFIISHMLRVPQSLSMTLAMAFVGISLGYGKYPNIAFTSGMLLFWAISTISAALLAIIAMNAIRRTGQRANIWKTVRYAKLILIVLSFLAAFVLGANTIGFLFESVSSIMYGPYVVAIIVAAVVFGSVAFSGGELRMIGSNILPLRYMNALVSQATSIAIVELATLFSIPASNTQTFTASLYGAGLSYGTRIIRKRPLAIIIASWIGTAGASFILGFLISLAMRSI